MGRVACATCGVPVELFNETTLRNEHGSFYCPNGHRSVFTGQTTTEKALEKAKKELEQTKDSLKAARKSERYAFNQVKAQKRHAAALRGQITRLRKKYEPHRFEEGGDLA